MILSAQHISKSFGDDLVLDDISFHLEDREKAALVGINGAGKSTLLKIIVGELEPDEGTVTISKNSSVGYLAQYQETFGSRTVYEEVLEAKRDLIDMEAQIRTMEVQMQDLSGVDADAFIDRYHRLLHSFDTLGGYSYRSEAAGVLKGLGFCEDDFDRPCSELSGGQKTRVALAGLLVTKPDLLLLDEPTNHLDISSISWLESFLINYKGAVLVVSHDRYFLDRVVTKVIEISLRRSTVYSGNYSSYADKAAKAREEKQRAYINKQREIRRQQEVIDKLRSFNREKSVKRAESREKMLEKAEAPERPAEEKSEMKITLVPAVLSGKDVLTVEGLEKSFGEKHLFSGLSFDIRRGEHVALIGENGTGKTTILKVINQVTDADDGMFRLGTNVQIGYYDQEQQELHPDKTLFEEIADEYPDLTQTEIRNTLAAFLFTGDDVFLRVADLSGGERGRLSLAKLMLSGANFLILDEPTNHLDIVSREILESALNLYEGTVLFVSHDRYLINRCASRILELAGGRLTSYPGNYDYYLEKKNALQLSDAEKAKADRKVSRQSGGGTGQDGSGSGDLTAVKAEWLAQKEEQANQRKRLNRISRIEDEISGLEDSIARIDSVFVDPEVATDPVRLEELSLKHAEIRAKLDALYAEWEELSDLL